MDVKVGDVSGKTFVITGANCGLGYASMKAIMLGGGHVVMGCRSEEKAQAAIEKVKKETEGKGSVEFGCLDLADLDSVKQFAEGVKAKHSELYCLMNNAGVMFCDNVKTKQGFDMQIGTNHFGHFALTMQLLPLLKASKDDPRVVTVSSMAAESWMSGGKIDFENIHCEKRFDTQKVYGQSKLANQVFNCELVKRLEGSNVKALVTHPGYTRTELSRNSSWPTWLGIKLVIALSMGADQGTLSQLHAATSHDVESGDYYGPKWKVFGNPVKLAALNGAQDAEQRRKLWELSEKVTGVSFPAQW